MSKPRVAVLLSLCLPGLGQLYNRSWGKAVVFLGLTWLLTRQLGTLMAGVMLGEQPIESLSVRALATLTGLLTVVLVVSAVDARRVALRRATASL